MTIEEFFKYLETKDIETQIVYLRYRYSYEDTWTYSNEILEVDMGVDGFYVWKTDWNEGQEDIEILGCIAVSDIEVPLFIMNLKKGDIVFSHEQIKALLER